MQKNNINIWSWYESSWIWKILIAILESDCVVVIFLAYQANVMLEYDIDEAQALLEKNLATASRNLDGLEEDLDFLRDQFTTTEVSILKQGQLWKWGSLFS